MLKLCGRPGCPRVFKADGGRFCPDCRAAGLAFVSRPLLRPLPDDAPRAPSGRKPLLRPRPEWEAEQQDRLARQYERQQRRQAEQEQDVRRCAREGCPNEVPAERSKYCSAACCMIANNRRLARKRREAVARGDVELLAHMKQLSCEANLRFRARVLQGDPAATARKERRTARARAHRRRMTFLARQGDQAAKEWVSRRNRAASACRIRRRAKKRKERRCARESCGNTLAPRRRKYCSYECKRAARRERIAEAIRQGVPGAAERYAELKRHARRRAAKSDAARRMQRLANIAAELRAGLEKLLGKERTCCDDAEVSAAPT